MSLPFSLAPAAKGHFRHQCGAVALEVDPENGGRIVECSLDGRNVLARAGSSPQHGSSFWPSPQRDWDWPPPPELDRLPWRASVDGEGLTLRSEVNARLGLSAVQRLTPAANGMRIRYRLENHGKTPRAVAPWENSRVRPGGLTFYASLAPTFAPSTLTITPEHGVAWFRHDPLTMRENKKAFADGSEGWLAHLDGELLLLKSFAKVPRERQAPTEAEIEIYVDQTGLFVEVEEQGPYETLPPGGSSGWTVRWQLLRVPPGISREEGSRELVAWVRAASAP